jgi:hypothetical protein
VLNNSGWIRLRGHGALLPRVALGAGSVAWSAANRVGPPLGLLPVTSQAGFANLVAKVRPAVVQITPSLKVTSILVAPSITWLFVAV